MPPLTLLQKNLKKCDELDESVAEIAKDAVHSAFDKNMTFTISETRRTYERQCLLLSQGRTKAQITANAFPYGFRLTAQQMKDMLKIYEEGRNLQGPTVTWTLDSNHVRGLAMDIYPINTTYSELAQHFLLWGITHPYLSDMPHFELVSAKSRKPEIYIAPSARLKALSRALLRQLPHDVRRRIENEYYRLKARLGV